jgi:hypothetical protein
MAKVSIIEIDLGADIDEIISENVEELTGQAKQELDEAIEAAKERDALREQKASDKKKADDAVTAVMEAAYQRLVDAGADGVLCSDIMDIVNEHVPNSSAFTLRMKKILRDQGNPYALERKKRKGNPHYIFSPFNQENEDQ